MNRATGILRKEKVFGMLEVRIDEIRSFFEAANVGGLNHFTHELAMVKHVVLVQPSLFGFSTLLYTTSPPDSRRKS